MADLRFADGTFSVIQKLVFEVQCPQCNSNLYPIRGITKNEVFRFSIDCVDLSGGVAFIFTFVPSSNDSVEIFAAAVDSTGEQLAGTTTVVEPSKLLEGERYSLLERKNFSVQLGYQSKEAKVEDEPDMPEK